MEHGYVLHTHSAQHADLLVHGEDGLQPGMGDVLCVQNCQCHSHSDAVIAAQGGALGVDGVSLHHQVQPFLIHILGAVGGLFADHVHVALEDDRLGVLIAGGSFLDDNHIVQLVLVRFQPPFPGEGHQPVAGGLGVAGAVGDGAQLLKETEYAPGLQMFQNRHGSCSFTGIISSDGSFRRQWFRYTAGPAERR